MAATDLPADEERWNHNIAYHRIVFASVPAGAVRALDVGCGEGILARRLRRVVPQVVGLDHDGEALALARAQAVPAGVSYVQGDIRHPPFPPGSFDLVASVAVIHHLYEEEALARMAELLRPGGTLVVVGLARSRRPSDLLIDVAAVLDHRVVHAGRPVWQSPAPVLWPPPSSYSQVARISARVLPGRRFRRRLLWRYSLVWERPDVVVGP
ncbi:MAG TPA: class I SAM-dependent methyltransferase [Acidimicrobiales bacterium]|nr:class I SAM-dependent methyltransferase [Acidimicrobiales bacterium]